MKKKELKFTTNLQDQAGLELIKQDVERIREITPGFQPPVQISPVEDLAGPFLKPIEGKTILQMPLKKEKKE